jgi:hypothetical protein
MKLSQKTSKAFEHYYQETTLFLYLKAHFAYILL